MYSILLHSEQQNSNLVHITHSTYVCVCVCVCKTRERAEGQGKQ